MLMITTIEFRDIEIIHTVLPKNLRTAEELWRPPVKSFIFCINNKYSQLTYKFLSLSNKTILTAESNSVIVMQFKN